jgi:hypothetical protein
VYKAVAMAKIKIVATNYTAFDFFNDKTSIAHSMRMILSEVFDRDLFAIIDGLQITRVELPGDFQNAILASIEAKQNISQSTRYRGNMVRACELHRSPLPLPFPRPPSPSPCHSHHPPSADSPLPPQPPLFATLPWRCVAGGDVWHPAARC